MRDHAGEPMDAAGPCDQADARLWQSENRILWRDDDVAGERDLEPATHRDAVDRGDRRLVEVEAMRKAGKPVAETRPLPGRRPAP